ncbi:MAG: transporter substrate-binding domain-containing protein [Synergistaceae bacterium]|nr:transporter substrate-binding domain-containing protein [Synergistaceae bacterium]
MKKFFAGLALVLLFAGMAFAADFAPRKFIVGTTGTELPYSLLKDDNSWSGAEADFWAEVKKRTGWEVEVKRCADLAMMFGELDSGRIDVAANCLAITPSRLEAHIASDPLYGDAQVIIVKPESKYYTVEDLRGLEIGCTAGQAAQNTVEKIAPQYGWVIRPYDATPAGFMDANLARIPAYAHTVSTVEKYEREQGMKFRMLDQKLFGNNVGWWFRDDAASKQLRDELNIVIADMHKDGMLAEITKKYFYEDMTQFISDKWLKTNR